MNEPPSCAMVILITFTQFPVLITALKQLSFVNAIRLNSVIGKTSVHELLDLSAAFDTVDHNTFVLAWLNVASAIQQANHTGYKAYSTN